MELLVQRYNFGDTRHIVGVESMAEQVPSPAWLEKINTKLAAKGIAPADRVRIARETWFDEQGIAWNIFCIDHPSFKTIINWFSQNTKFGALQQEAFRLGAFLWDCSFWSLNIPIAYGMQSITADRILACVQDMPVYQKNLLIQNASALDGLCQSFIAQLTLFHLLETVSTLKENHPVDTLYGVELLEAADLHFESVTYQLSKPSPNPRIIETLRFVVEVALKAILACHHKRAPREVKEFGGKQGHDLSLLYQAASETGCTFTFPKASIQIFPDVSKRYEAGQFDPQMVWGAFQIALEILLQAVDKIEHALNPH